MEDAPHRRVSGQATDAEGGYGSARHCSPLVTSRPAVRNLNNDPEQDYFADGITTDLTTDLAQMPGAFVIGRGTAFTYKNKQIDFRTLGKDLGIRWAVQGAVRRNGGQVRVNVSLTDIASGRDVWSDRFDGDRTNLAALQDQIMARLARSLNIELIQAESRRSEADRWRNPDAMDFIMRGWAKFYPARSKIEMLRQRTCSTMRYGSIRTTLRP
ncbi:hypothetical protein [Bradyrhizobium australiense]|uniref:hypothetical protein n=1 Tax=Bradyrhizobium australiense TaxID=2721161 RepID=UPI001F40AFDF|nr:hypothetical protein [Bradyrhizobium australiense]